MWLFGLYCLALLTLLPYIAGFAIVERLRGWLKAGAIGILLILCFIPAGLMQPEIQRANLNSPDAGGFLMLEALMMVVPLLIEAIAGMISAGVQQARQRKVVVT